MLPRACMVATKNPLRKIALIFAVAGLMGFGGCKPAGPRELVQGDELLREGKAAEAVPRLKRATGLMPDEPRAWNLLGVAYHLAGEPHLALQAYRQALAKDRSNIVSVTHYNLGSLLLEQGNASGAVDELRSYTLITNSPLGLARLGSAQLRLRQWDGAERSFAAALRIDSKNIEALNGMGVVRAHRNQKDAIHYFNSALQIDRTYGPAMLNAASLAYHSPATKPAALQRYLDYLAAHPRSELAEPVRTAVRELESELAPRSASVSAPPAIPKIVAQPLTNRAPLSTITQAQAHTAPDPPRQSVPTNVPRLVVAPPRPLVATPVRTNQTAAAPSSVATITNVPVPIPVTVVTVKTESVPRIAPAEPLARAAQPSVAPAPPVHEETWVNGPAAEPEKRGFFARLNPFRGKTRNAGATNELPQSVVLAPPPTAPPAEPVTSMTTKPMFPRYGYQQPPLPAVGNRAGALRAMEQGLQAHRAGRTNDALAAYRRAVSADPAYFEAQYNAALLAFHSGDLRRALAGWETALAIEPDSINARYNLALALKQAGYAQDAVEELERILVAKPEESRAHLSLANLYAQQLNDRAKARIHYVRLLELEPRNPQAPAIRFWLAANP
jgi:tetratricopeptide (TPR) repeat protein